MKGKMFFILLFGGLVMANNSCKTRWISPKSIDLSDNKISLYYSPSGLFYLKGKGAISLDRALSHFIERYPNVEIRDNINLYQDTQRVGYHLLVKLPLPAEVEAEIAEKGK